MTRKAVWALTLIVLALGGWLVASLFWGTQSPGVLIVPLFVCGLAAILVLAASRVSHKVWICAGFFILAGLFLPVSIFYKVLPAGEAQPFEAPTALALFLMPSIAIVIAALLLHSGLNLLKERQSAAALAGEDAQARGKHPARVAAVALVLSALLLAKALHNFYWLVVWDSTYDPLGHLWLFFPILATLLSSFTLFFALPGKTRLASILYLLLIPAFIAVSLSAQSVSFRELTEERAERVSQALETYHDQEGRYPQELRQLTPGYILSLPDPVIIYGQKWCYNGGDDYYRLGYVSRQHWSDPRLFGQTYSTKGQVPDLRPCEEQVIALLERFPDYPYEYWMNGE